MAAVSAVAPNATVRDLTPLPCDNQAWAVAGGTLCVALGEAEWDRDLVGKSYCRAHRGQTLVTTHPSYVTHNCDMADSLGIATIDLLTSQARVW